MVEAGADTDDLIGHKADLDVGIISVQQEGAVFVLHTGKTRTDFHNRYLISKIPLLPLRVAVSEKQG